MTACNATLATATVTECPDDPFACGSTNTISNCYVDGEPTVHVELHTLTCAFTHTGGRLTHEAMDDNGTLATWCDDTPGATNHKPKESCPVCGRGMSAFMAMGPGRKSICLTCADDIAGYRSDR